MPYIYALRNKTTDLVYYGSTKKTLQTRFSNHKAHYNYHKKGKRTYMTCFRVLSCPTAYIELVEEVSEEEMATRERWWIDNHPCVNKLVPTQTQAEWYVKNREHAIAKASVYQKEHLAEIMERRRQKSNSLRRPPSHEPPLDAL